MADALNDVDRAQATIRNASLRYPDEELLMCFLEDSARPTDAARYILQERFVGRDGVNLTSLLSGWKQLIAAFAYDAPPSHKPNRAIVTEIEKRDGGKCCITGLKGSLLDPLVVVPILPTLKPIEEEPLACPQIGGIGIVTRLVPIHIQQRDKATLRIGGPDVPSIVENVPAVRFANFTNLSTPNMDTPDVSLLQVISRFAKPIRWACIAKEITAKQSQTQARRVFRVPGLSLACPILDYAAVSITMMWRLVPDTLRIQVYRGLMFLGARLYGSSSSLKVQRLPFGMYLKTARANNHAALANEYGTLQLVRRHTQIPVPRPLDLVSDVTTSYLLTSRVPGHLLGTCIDTLSDDEVNTLVTELQSCLGQLRAISKDVAPQYAICNALGKACYDYRIIAGTAYDAERGDFAGPFVDEEAFSKHLQTGALPGVSHSSGHDIVFTHGDLNMRNILIQNGRLSGIVDWENAGWFPEYWDYTKVHFATKLQKRWLGIVDRVFAQFEDFKTELATERQYWEYCY